MGSVTPLITARALNPLWRRRLASSLRVEMGFAVHHPDANPWPAGAVDYRAEFWVSWDAEDMLSAGEFDARVLNGLAETDPVSVPATTSGFAFEATGDPECFGARVGSAHLLVADLMVSDLIEALDARSGDAAHIGATILDVGEGGLHPDLLEQVEGFANRLLIVSDVEIAPPWRGLRLGLLGTGLTLQHLAPGSAVAALHAMQPGLHDDQERTASHRRLATYWQQLGFQPFRHEVLVLDLAMGYLDDALQHLIGQTG